MTTIVKTPVNWKETWKERLDTLRLKLELGKMDLREEIEGLEEDIKGYFGRLKAQLKLYVKQHEKARLLVGRLEELELQLALGKADTEDLLYLEIRKLRDKMHAIKWDALDWLKEVKDENVEELKELIDDEMEFYTAQLEMINVQLHLGKAEAKEKWDELRKVMTRKLHALRGRLETEAEGKFDDLKKEMAARLRKWADRID